MYTALFLCKLDYFFWRVGVNPSSNSFIKPKTKENPNKSVHMNIKLKQIELKVLVAQVLKKIKRASKPKQHPTNRDYLFQFV